MTVMDRLRIELAFCKAQDYDAHARVQRDVAEALAARIAALPLPPSPRVLEIGCGTGFLTRALRRSGLSGEWHITDISQRMIERCRDNLGERPDTYFAVLDGEYGEPAGGPFDLICSSLAMQWFDDQPAALARMLGWLAPDGHCIFTTVASGSFAQWRAAHMAEGLSPGTRDFLSAAELNAAIPNAQAAPVTLTHHVEQHDSGLDFVRALRAIGAHTARANHQPLSPSEMRSVLRRFEASGAEVTYEVATCHYRAPA